jgi:hypothetical protein
VIKGDAWMRLIGAVRNSLLYIAGNMCVSMGHAGMTLIGVVRISYIKFLIYA